MDKYIQYGILEGLDVVEWVFSKGSIGESGDGGDGWTDGEKWEVLRMCLEKHVGRVMGMRRRVRAVDREDEAARAKRAAEKLESGEGVGEDEDVEPEGECLDLPQSSSASHLRVLRNLNLTDRAPLLAHLHSADSAQRRSSSGPKKLETPRHPSTFNRTAWKKSFWGPSNISSLISYRGPGPIPMKADKGSRGCWRYLKLMKLDGGAYGADGDGTGSLCGG